MCFIWGYLDGAINIHTLQILGFEFTDKSGPFAVYNLVNGIWVFCMDLIQGQIDENDADQIKWYTIAVGTFGVIGSLVTFFFPFGTEDTPKTVEEKEEKLLVKNTDSIVQVLNKTDSSFVNTLDMTSPRHANHLPDPS